MCSGRREVVHCQEPDLLTIRVLRRGANPLWELNIDGYPPARMRPRDAIVYRRFHARCMEQLPEYFARVPRKRWRMQIVKALLEGRIQQAEEERAA